MKLNGDCKQVQGEAVILVAKATVSELRVHDIPPFQGEIDKRFRAIPLGTLSCENSSGELR